MKPRTLLFLLAVLLLVGPTSAQDKSKDKLPDLTKEKAAEEAKEKALKEEFKKLDGTYNVIHLERAGQKLPEDKVKAINLQVTVTDKKMISRAGSTVNESTFTIDPAKTPREIDTVVEKNNRIEKGIYKLDGDTLTICAAESGNDRPTDFTTKSGTPHVMIIMKRTK